jgi:HK97 family phage major capsid protein
MGAASGCAFPASSEVVGVPDFLEDVLADIDGELKQLNRDQRTGSRYVGPNATRDAARAVAEGKSFSAGTWRTAPSSLRGGGSMTGREFLLAVKAARQGDPDANRRLASHKVWTEGTDSAGGFLVSPEVLPGIVAARRAAAPLLDRVTTFNVTSNEVIVTKEGDPVEVEWTGEGVTKPVSTGSVAQAVSAAHKLAGVTYVSDELLNDANGNVEQLVSRQFAQATDAKIDAAILSGSGVGQPLGITNVPGVNSVPVDGQEGQELFESIAKSIARLVADGFYLADTVVLHPSVAVRFSLAKTSTGSYLFANGIGSLFPQTTIVLDSNVDESVIVVGDFRAGVHVYQRQPLTIDASTHVAFESDETAFRCHARYGACIVAPQAFEVLSGVTP